MIKVTPNIDGMKCGMCEAHVNDAIRRSASIIKINTSHKNNKTIFIIDNNINVEDIIASIEAQGYKVLSKNQEEYIKKGLFHKL